MIFIGVKTFRIKLGGLRKLVREMYEECGMGTEKPMAETDVGPSWPHPWPKPKNSDVLRAHKAVMDYLGPEQTNDLAMAKYVRDPYHDGVVAIRIEDGGVHAGTNMDFVVYNCDGECSDNDVEEVEFKTWPPGVSGGYR